jgi:hypothetical protein
VLLWRYECIAQLLHRGRLEGVIKRLSDRVSHASGLHPIGDIRLQVDQSRRCRCTQNAEDLFTSGAPGGSGLIIQAEERSSDGRATTTWRRPSAFHR